MNDGCPHQEVQGPEGCTHKCEAFEAERCFNCRHRYDLELWEFDKVGSDELWKHPQEGFICDVFATEGVMLWHVGTNVENAMWECGRKEMDLLSKETISTMIRDRLELMTYDKEQEALVSEFVEEFIKDINRHPSQAVVAPHRTNMEISIPEGRLPNRIMITELGTHFGTLYYPD